MKSGYCLSSSQIHGLMRGEAVGPFALYALAKSPDGHTLPLRIAHATLTLYCRYGRPLALRFSEGNPAGNPIDMRCVRVAFDETEDDRWRRLILTLVDSPSGEPEGQNLPEVLERRVFWTPKGAWDAARNRVLTGGLLAVAFDPPWSYSLPPSLPQPVSEAARLEEGGRKESFVEKTKAVDRKGVYHEVIRTRGGRTECFVGYRAWGEEKSLPSSLEILVDLKPVWLDNETACAQVSGNKPCFLYPPHAAFCGVEAVPKGIGNCQMVSGGERVPFMGTDILGYRLVLPEPLYWKCFRAQPEGRHVPQIRSPFEKEGIPSLWAYGGRIVGDDIHPFVFAMDCLKGETTIQPFSLLYWRKQGVTPFSTKGAFQDDFEEDETRTLCESLEAGMSVIHLEIGWDIRGRPIRVPYQSYRLSENFIFYRRQEEP